MSAMRTTTLLAMAAAVAGQVANPVNYQQGGLDWIAGTNNNATITGNACNGQNQSPLNIVDGAVGGGAQFNAVYDPTLAPLNLAYSPQSSYKVQVNDHTIELLYNSTTAASDGIFIPSVGFVPVLQFHFHYPSEHLLNGLAYDLEIHVVHQGFTSPAATAKTTAVIGAVFAVSPDPTYINPFIANLLSVAPTTQQVASSILTQTPQTTTGTLDATNVIAAGTGKPVFNLYSDVLFGANPKRYYRYQGSLTTPPCTEGLYWHWMPTPIPIAQSQLTVMTNLLAAAQEGLSRGADNRPTQPQNGRKVSKSFKNLVPKKAGRGLMSVL